MKNGLKFILVLSTLILVTVMFFGCSNSHVVPEPLLPTPDEIPPVVDSNDGDNDGVEHTPEFVFSKSADEVLGYDVYQNAINDFAFRLFGEMDLTKNTCISPLSVYLALAMLSNAASGTTLDEIASALGMSVYEINEYASYLYSLYVDDESNAKTVTIANSVWCKNGIIPYQALIDNLKNYYGAEVYKSDFTPTTVDQINEWVKKNTKGMIDKIIDKLNSACIMQLINALTFESAWSGGDLNQNNSIFNNIDGTIKNVPMLSNKLSSFYSTQNADAFIYRFANGRFGFMGILPNESLEEYLPKLDGEEFLNLISNKVTGYDVYTRTPVFNHDFNTSLIEPLKNMGIIQAFDKDNANFKAGWPCDDYNVFVSAINHKTHIEVSKSGVKAAAVTQIGMDCTSAGPNQVEPPKKYIYLTRPFVYVIVDTVYNVPVFVGTVTTM